MRGAQAGAGRVACRGESCLRQATTEAGGGGSTQGGAPFATGSRQDTKIDPCKVAGGAQCGPDEVYRRVHALSGDPFITLGAHKLLQHQLAARQVGVLGGGELWHLDPRRWSCR